MRGAPPPTLEGVAKRKDHGHLCDPAPPGWRSAADLEAAARSTAEGERMPDDIRWIRSYVLSEPANGGLGTVCIYQASSPEAIRRHAAAAELPVDKIVQGGGHGARATRSGAGRGLISHENERSIMKRIITVAALLLAAATALIGGRVSSAHGGTGASAAPASVAGVFASGFNNPRGLTFGPDGKLYVAEGGLGGSHSTVGQCPQAAGAAAPYTGSTNDPVNGGRISKISRSGKRHDSGECAALEPDQPGPRQPGQRRLERRVHRPPALRAAVRRRLLTWRARRPERRDQGRPSRQLEADREPERLPGGASGRPPRPGGLRSGRDVVQHDRRRRSPVPDGLQPR